MSRLFLDVDGNQHVLAPPGPWRFGPEEPEDDDKVLASIDFRLRYTTRWALHLPDAGTSVNLDGQPLGAAATVLLRGLDHGHVVALRRGDRSCVLKLRADHGLAGDRRTAAVVRVIPVGTEPVHIGCVGGDADLQLTAEHLTPSHVRLKRTRTGALRVEERAEPAVLRYDDQLVRFANLGPGERFEVAGSTLLVTPEGVELLSGPDVAAAATPAQRRPPSDEAGAEEDDTAGQRSCKDDGKDHGQITTDLRLSLSLDGAHGDYDVHLHHPEATVGDLLHKAGVADVVSTVFHEEREIAATSALLDAALPEGAVLTTKSERRACSGSDVDRPFGLDLRTQLTGSNTVPFNRPPRPGRPDDPPPLVPPRRERPATPAQFSWALLVGSLLMAGLTWAVTRQPSFAVFTALSPLLSIATYVEQLRRQRRTDEDNARKFDKQMEDLTQAVGVAADAERSRLTQRCPDLGEVRRRAAVPSRRLWERRPGAHDFLDLNAGSGDVPWAPPMKDGSGDLEPEVQDVVDASRLEAAPVHVDLSGGGVVGVVGDRDVALDVARNLLLQAAVQAGPADLTVGAFVDPGRHVDWEWVKWLPHSRRTQTVTSPRWTASTRVNSNRLLRALPNNVTTSTCLVLVDSDVLLEGRISPARAALGLTIEDPSRPVLQISGVVIAPSADRLPAVCTTVVDVASNGFAQVTYVATDEVVANVRTGRLNRQEAMASARDLARFEDPEHSVVGGGLPDLVRLLPLLELPELDGPSILRRWASSAARTGLTFPIGLTEQGLFELDLLRDGPHGLVAGMTGSGKSEFLRSLVLSLAASYDPSRLNLILIDFKGGAAFDVCSGLPHVVGMVTNLDQQLANRALRALEAELHYRERLFADAGVDNVDDYRVARPAAPLPRLLIVVDEFAMLAKEYPDVLTSLVSVAAVGRTLGVHLLLATQRPAGVVSDDITANTNLRVALQVKSVEDSSEVIDVPDAAAISRHLRGRAFVRLGHDELVPLQTALVTTVSEQDAQAPLEVAPFGFDEQAPEPAAPTTTTTSDDEQPTDSARLVAAIKQAYADSKLDQPRKPWPEPLGPLVPLRAVATADARRVLFALADDPGQQRQYPVGWNLEDGNLLLVGLPGSGTTSALAAVALTLSQALPPEKLSLLVLDAGTGELSALARLPHTRSVVLTGRRRRQVKLLRHLQTELRRRRDDRSAAAATRTVVLLDNFAALQAELDDAYGLDLLQDFYQVFRDGPQVGISFAVTADRILAVPGAVANVVTQKWMFRAADPHDYAHIGIAPAQAPASVPGRAVLAQTGLHAQVGTLQGSLHDAVNAVAALHPDARPQQDLVRDLPNVVSLDELGIGASWDEERWVLPLGMRESDLECAELVLHEGDHVLVSGPSKSGRSTTLATVAALLKRTRDAGGRNMFIAAAGAPRSPLRNHPAVDQFQPITELAPLIAEVYLAKGPVALLLDDAESFVDTGEQLLELLGKSRPGFHLFAAGRNGEMRSLYAAWLKRVQLSRCGVLLRPDVDNGDAGLFGITLRTERDIEFPQGRGYIIENGDAVLAQVATGDIAVTHRVRR